MTATQNGTTKSAKTPSPPIVYAVVKCPRCSKKGLKLTNSRVPAELRKPYADLCTKCITPEEYAGITAVLDQFIILKSGGNFVPSIHKGATVSPTTKTTKSTKTAKPLPIDLVPAVEPAAPAPKAAKAKATKAKADGDGKAPTAADIESELLGTIVKEEKTPTPARLKQLTKGAKAKTVSAAESELLDVPATPKGKAAKATKAAAKGNGEVKITALDVLAALKAIGGKATVADLAEKQGWPAMKVQGSMLALKAKELITYANRTMTITKKGKAA